MQFHNYPMLLEEWYVRRVRETMRDRRERVEAIRTREEAQAYAADVQQVIHKAFGRLPARPSLKARTVKTTEFSEFLLEHVLFESRPGFLVTANLYLPQGIPGKAPAVLFTCGHSPNGKAYPLYVSACIRLMREGYIVLSYDPVNQGERDFYTLLDREGKPTRENCCNGHNIIGRQMRACGDWLGTWRVWDGMRAVDYLLTRPEVDRNRLGVTGQSGGGTLSSFLWAMDHRLRMVASSCWITGYLNDLENSMPADEEQYPPGFLAAGLDKIDFFISRAGEPALLLGQEFDFFDDRGLKQGYRELLKIHRLLGAKPETCRLSMDTCEHEYSVANQRAMLAFFNRQAGKPAPAEDRPIDVPEEAQLLVTPDCDVNRIGSRPIYELVAAEARRIVYTRKPVESSTLPALVRRVLNVHVPGKAPYYRRLFHTPTQRESTGQKVFRFAVETDTGLLVMLRHVCKTGTPYRLTPGARALLYLPNLDSQQELERPDTLTDVDDFWLLDVRGLGEGVHHPQDPLALYGHDYMTTGYAMLYNESMLGDRLYDVLNVIRLLRAEGAQEIHLAGRGQGAVLALLAGVVDASIASVASHDAPESIQAMVEAPLTYWPAVNFPVDILKHFDLPDLRCALGARLVVDTIAAPDVFEL